MRFIERQNRLERQVYLAIDELEDVFNVEVPFYPEVRWLGRKGYVEDLGLPKRYLDEVENLRVSGRSVLISRENMIILNGTEPVHINEESSHYVHYSASHIDSIERPFEEYPLVSSVVEMFGYLGSLLLGSRRKNPFSDMPDYFTLASNRKIPFKDAVRKLGALPEEIEDTFIYTQGYGLGERIFYALHTNQIEMDYVQKLFRNGFKKPGEITTTFEELRKMVWPIG